MTTVTLIISGRRLEGWTAATVTRALETVAGRFQITLSERDPGTEMRRAISPGEACVVELDGDRVLTGYVDSVSISYEAESHALTVVGRDATGDLVDCSAASQPGEWHDASLIEIASALTDPFGVPVRAEVDIGAPFRRFRIEEAESVFEAIERACRFRGVLPLASGDGALILGAPTRARSAVRLERGVNILSASGESSWIDRHSEYTLLGQQPGSDALTGPEAAHVSAQASDAGVTRHRPLTIVGEQALDTAEAQARIDWEASVRAARARSATITVQGWRETEGGALWAPGRLVRVTDDWLGLDRELLVSTTVQSISDGGTIARLTLYPSNAFVRQLETEAAPAAAGGGVNWWE